MNAYIVSPLMGLAVGAGYALVHVRSPAPPLVALLGLLGMVVGEQVASNMWRFYALPAHASPTSVSDAASRSGHK